MRTSIALLLSFLTACGAYARGLPLGSPEPPRPRGCPIAFVHVTPSEASSRWREVGVVCLTKAFGVSVDEAYEAPDLRDELAAEACDLGGEVVTLVGTCTNARASGLEFGVYTARHEPVK